VALVTEVAHPPHATTLVVASSNPVDHVAEEEVELREVQHDLLLQRWKDQSTRRASCAMGSVRM
jgi:hypothetical protein